MHSFIQEWAQFLAAGGAAVATTFATLTAFAVILAAAGGPLANGRRT
jgi:hypothetical protein